MRRFTDSHGRIWEVVAGRESWGGFVALFIPVQADETLRQASLLASGHEQANAELEAMDDQGIGELLERSVPNPLGE
jgi:hypothetical protein